MIDFRSHVLQAGPHFRQVGLDVDRHAPAFAGAGIEQIDLAQLIVDQGGPLGGEAANIRAVVVQNFDNGLGAKVVAEYPEVSGTPGEKEDLLAAIYRKEVRSLLVRNLDRVERCKAGDPDRARAAAAVVAPR